MDRAMIQVRIIAVASAAPAEISVSSADRRARAAIEDMTLADFAALQPAGLARIAGELHALIGGTGR